MFPAEGSLAQHMLAHVVAMGLVAPLIVLAWRSVSDARMPRAGYGLVISTVLQLVLLWGWHLPAVFQASAHHPLGMAAMHGSLFLAAIWFWQAVIAEVDRAGWKALAALLVTGKLFCLLGVLLTFAPRVILGSHGYSGHHAPLDDQQLAGLVMLTACPLVYVGAAVVIARRWLATLRASRGWSPAPERF